MAPQDLLDPLVQPDPLDLTGLLDPLVRRVIRALQERLVLPDLPDHHDHKVRLDQPDQVVLLEQPDHQDRQVLLDQQGLRVRQEILEPQGLQDQKVLYGKGTGPLAHLIKWMMRSFTL